MHCIFHDAFTGSGRIGMYICIYVCMLFHSDDNCTGHVMFRCL